jgi:hypothetical protein
LFQDTVDRPGGEVLPGGTDQFAALLHSERARYERLIRDAKIQPD